MTMELLEATDIILKENEEIVKRGRFKGKVPRGPKTMISPVGFYFFPFETKMKIKWKKREGELILTNTRLIVVPTKLEPNVSLELEKLLVVATTNGDKLRLSMPLGPDTITNMVFEVDGVSEWINAISAHAQNVEQEIIYDKKASVRVDPKTPRRRLIRALSVLAGGETLRRDLAKKAAKEIKGAGVEVSEIRDITDKWRKVGLLLTNKNIVMLYRRKKKDWSIAIPLEYAKSVEKKGTVYKVIHIPFEFPTEEKPIQFELNIFFPGMRQDKKRETWLKELRHIIS